MNESVEASLLSALVGVVLGILGTYVFDLRKLRIERAHLEQDRLEADRRERSALATALLIEMRNLEVLLRRFALSKVGKRWRGGLPVRLFPHLVERVTHLSPAAQLATNNFYGLVQDAEFILQDAQKEGEPTPHQRWLVQLKASAALHELVRARVALEVEGGVVPPSPEIGVFTYPNLPSIPARQFDMQFSESDYPDAGIGE